ncbi:MAG TPA: L-threonylcarbamoyladenylate synthase [Actinomycetota bacterium]|nr:L-threonylcarbamoyladenylate synthase [Actinomycetota bacterium]
MARYFEVHPDDPQPRAIAQAAQLIRDGGLVAYPTDSGYALGCELGNSAGVQRIRDLRQLDDKHHFTLVCHDLAQLSQFVQLRNPVFRAVKAATPGSYTFILPATREVPRRLMHPKKRTVGARIPRNAVAQALVAELGEPLMSSTLLMPGEEEPMSRGWEVQELLGTRVDAVIDAGDCLGEPTTVVDLTGTEAVIRRLGAGDPRPFE